MAGDKHEGGRATIVEAIRPAVELARAEAGLLAENAVRLNVLRVVDRSRNTRPVLSAATAAGAVRVAGAVYDLVSGEVVPV